MSKQVIFNEEAIAKLAKGVNIVANVVKITLGPRGRAVVFNRGVGPTFSLDGVTVAKQIELEDEAEDDGATLVKSVARETDKEGGDGTTTATILTQSILNQGIKVLSAGMDHTKMKQGVDEALDIVRKCIKKMTHKVATKQDISNIATISSRDREVGDMVADIVYKLGQDAVVSVEESNVFGLHSEVVEGLKLDKGYVSPYMITHQERGECILENPYILVTSQVISANQDIVNILNTIFNTEKRSLLIVCDTIKGEALATAIINKMQGRLLVAAIQAPGIGDDKTEQMKDIVSVVGGNFISEELGKKTEDVELSDFGKADRVVIGKNYTIIVGGKGNPKARIALIKTEIKNETSDYKKELRENRLAKLTGGVAVIKVGTISEEENGEKRYRIEDAVRASQSALSEGIVPGAGMTLYLASQEIAKRANKELDLSYRAGLKIIEDAIKEPARQIILNTGANPDVILSKCEAEGEGYDSSTGTYVNLLDKGIIDPAKVVRVGLENAVSIASMFLITGAVITEVVKEKPLQHDE